MGDLNTELSDFLRHARGRVDPASVALPPDGRVRRVRGLRREEVALLAGVSSDYYTRLEQGRRIVPSRAVIDGLVRALKLDDAGRTHLQRLIGRPATNRTGRNLAQRARPSLLQFLDSVDAPALVLGCRTDVLATNRMARVLIADFERFPARERNYARWMLLSPDARRLFVDWDEQARTVVETLRLDLGRRPDDPLAANLVAELSSGSEQFRAWWESHDVAQRTWGTKRFDHPLVGRLDVNYETLTLPGDPDQTLFLYTTEAGTASRQAMNLLASWTLSPLSEHPPVESA